MKQVTVQLLREADGSYSCYVNDNQELNYGLIGEGNTAKEAMDNWMACYEAMKEAFKDGKHGEFVEAEFRFAEV